MAASRQINIGRYRHIITVLSKYGFGLLLDQMGILGHINFGKRTAIAGKESTEERLSAGERLRLSLEELGPAFIKLGQILSTRSDIIPEDVAEELKKLQDSVQPFSFSEVKSIIEEEFDDNIEKLYREFDEIPIAAASIAQVHHAVLNSGKQVAVKVQRPGIEKVIQLDLNILKDMAHFIDHHTKYGEIYDFESMVSEFERTMKEELDFSQEGENADTFRKNFLKDKGIAVPEVKWVYTTKHVLTMEYIEGMRIDEYDKIKSIGIDTRVLAERLADSVCNQIFRDGFFHADPHPGNIKVLGDGTIVLLDLGMVGVLTDTRKRMISNIFIGAASGDSRLIVKSIVELGGVPSRSNMKGFEKDVERIVDNYMSMSWDKMKIEKLLYEIFNMAFVNHIKIPMEFTLIAKAFGTLQTLMEKLAPDMNTITVAKPIANRLLIQSFSIEGIKKDVRKSLWSYKDLLIEFPSAMLNFLNKMEDEDFTVQMEIKDINRIQRRLERVINRMSFSIVLLAVSIIIAGIIIGSSLSASVGSEMYQLNIKILKAGLIVAGIIIAGLVISIFQSRR